MDYDYIKQIIPEKRPFFTKSDGITPLFQQ